MTTTTTTPTSGAADLPEALRRSTAADGKTELFNLPGYPLMVRAVDFNRIHTESEMRRAALLDEMQKAALAAGQATAAATQPAPATQQAGEVSDAMVLAALQVQYPAAYGQYLRHPANGPKTSLRTEAEIDTARRMIAAALDAAPQPTPTAQAADSVQEDAARLDFLIEQRAYVVSDPDACPGYWLHWARPDGSTWVQVDEHPTPRAAIDAGRKQ